MKNLLSNEIKSIRVENLIQHPYHQKIYGSRSTEYLETSIERTGDQPVNPIVAVPHADGMFWVVSGMIRLNILINKGCVETPVIIFDLDDENAVKHLIVDLNKSRIKNGKELLMEFRHYLDMFPQRKGIKGSRYDRIGKEIEMGRDKVKDLTILNHFFSGDADVILENVFAGVLSINQANQLKKLVEQHPEKFDSVSFEKLCNRNFDFSRLDYSIRYLNLDDDSEFDFIKKYLLKEFTPQEFHKILEQLGKVEARIQSHEADKVTVPDLSDTYTSDHALILHGDNSVVDPINPFGKKIKCLVGSPPYGNKRLNGEDQEEETGHNMTGQEYGEYLANTYERYIPYMELDGSIYVIIDDYRMQNGELACSLEYFVAAMRVKGFHLASRYIWEKSNPVPNNYKGKAMTNSIEFVYRFTLDPVNYYTNVNLFIESELPGGKRFDIKSGCTNHSSDGKTTRGEKYIQSHLKRLRNTLSEQNCIDVIKGNIARPEDFFRQAGEKRHTSTAPIYLTSVLILESTRPGEVCADIWNGVGNTMVSALLLDREYIGIEKEYNYYQQTVNRLRMTEDIIKMESEEGCDEDNLAA